VNEGFDLEPDLVMVSFFPYNDISDLLEMKWKKTDDLGLPTAVISLDTMVKRGRLAKRQPTEWKYAIPFLRNSHLFIMLGSTLEKYSPAAVEFIKKPLGVVSDKPRVSREEIDGCIYDLICKGNMAAAKDKVWRLFDGMKLRADQNGVKIEALMLASPDQVKKLAGLKLLEKTKALSTAQPQVEIKNQLTRSGIGTIDLLPELTDKSGEQYFFGRDGHLNVRGHGRVAEAIFRHLNLGINLTESQIQDLINKGILKF
jgi:hypothetical protein